MKFEITPEDAQPAALAVLEYYRGLGLKVSVEKAIDDAAPYRTTLLVASRGPQILVEAQGSLNYGRSLRELMAWIESRRSYAVLSIAVLAAADLRAGVLHELKRDGMGLLIVGEDGNVQEHYRPRNPALVVTPDPTLRFGAESGRVGAALKKFNEVDRKDGLRDMCEIVEDLTEKLGVACCRKGWMKFPEADFRAKNFFSQINELSRPEVYNAGRNPIFDSTMKDDLHAFRNTRNLVDHPVGSRRDDARRERQFPDKMLQGTRLASEIVSLKRRVR